MLAIQTVSITLSAGAMTVTFGQFEKVNEAAVYIEGSLTSDYVFEATRSIATNVVTVTIKKMQVSATNTWGNAITTDFTGKTMTVIADGD
jgi:hypothetical protein